MEIRTRITGAVWPGEDFDGEERPDADELDNFYLHEHNDVGYGSAEEEHIWIWPGCLA